LTPEEQIVKVELESRTRVDEGDDEDGEEQCNCLLYGIKCSTQTEQRQI
jgi:hypothetical protein